MRRGIVLAALLMLLVVSGRSIVPADDDDLPRLDPAAWGTDHVGKQFPPYVTGDECLFCHRSIGSSWSANRHALTMRLAEPADPAIAKLRQLDGKLADETEYLVGSRRATRFLKRSAEYGKLELLTSSLASQPGAHAEPSEKQWKHVGEPRWDSLAFGTNCAGCHATAVDTKTKAFSATSLDCFVCHGDVDLEHNEDTSLVLLSNENREPRQVTSICGQCHLRGGKSKSSQRPYPNTFVPGDNLFRDFQVDWSDSALQSLPAIEQHVWMSARDVAVYGRSNSDCLACHEVHAQSTKKHQKLEHASICMTCHSSRINKAKLKDELLPANRLQMHSAVCEY